MSSLPEEIIINILSRLPVKPILRFRCVCKAWCDLFETSNFVKLHLDNAIDKNDFTLVVKECPGNFYRSETKCTGHIYSKDYDGSSSSSPSSPSSSSSSSSSSSLLALSFVKMDYPFKSSSNAVQILGSCNGLLCINPSGIANCIWNPSTKEYKELPSPSPDDQFDFELTETYGFGYDCKNEDYKLVRILSPDGDDSENLDSQFEVYTLGSNSWGTIHSTHFNLSEVTVPGVFINGAIHWITSNDQVSEIIASFDVSEERFRDLPMPKGLYVDGFDAELGVLGRSLCLLAKYVDFWVMKEYGVRESWTKMFTISITVIESFQFTRPIHSFKNGEIIFEFIYQQDSDTNGLVSYDPNNEIARNLNCSETLDRDSTVIYVGSLVSLKSGTYVDSMNERSLRSEKRKKRKLEEG